MREITRRRAFAVAALALGLVALTHPAAGADVWANVGPAAGLAGLDGRYPLGNYSLDQHFSAVSAGVLSGVDVSGVPPMIAYFLAEVIWQLTAFLASALISLFAFAFSLDLVGGSTATGGTGALGPVSQAIHSIYAGVFGAPWLVVAVAVAGIWAMWRALVMRRYAETAGALGLSLIYIVVALFFVAAPAQTIGRASHWTNQMSGAFLSITRSGSPGDQAQAKQAGADQLFSLLVARPWSVLEFGGVEHCVRAGTGSGDSDPASAPVRPLPAGASRRLAHGEEVSAAGKTCVNDARKYSSHFLRFDPGSDERDKEYEALDSGDASKLPDSDPGKSNGSYRLGPPDKPATDAMEKGGQYQRLLVAVVVFVAELGAFLLLGSLSVGVILAQILLLLLLAFAPVALVAAVIPGRGHDFFKGWLAKLAGYLLRKAAYSLVLAVLLAVLAALSAATEQLGWLMSFGLQALFLWAVFIQRKALTEGLVGIATGPGAPGREATLGAIALYSGARAGTRPLRGAGRSARSLARGARRRVGGEEPEDALPRPASSAAPRQESPGEELGAVPEDGAAPAAAPETRPAAGSQAKPGERGLAAETSAGGSSERDASEERTQAPSVAAEDEPRISRDASAPVQGSATGSEERGQGAGERSVPAADRSGEGRAQRGGDPGERHGESRGEASGRSGGGRSTHGAEEDRRPDVSSRSAPSSARAERSHRQGQQAPTERPTTQPPPGKEQARPEKAGSSPEETRESRAPRGKERTESLQRPERSYPRDEPGGER